MRRIHRNVEYVINSADGAEWTWDAYQKNAYANGHPLHGTTKGTEADAVKDCEAAIDEAFDGKSNWDTTEISHRLTQEPSAHQSRLIPILSNEIIVRGVGI